MRDGSFWTPCLGHTGTKPLRWHGWMIYDKGSFVIPFQIWVVSYNLLLKTRLYPKRSYIEASGYISSMEGLEKPRPSNGSGLMAVEQWDSRFQP